MGPKNIFRRFFTRASYMQAENYTFSNVAGLRPNKERIDLLYAHQTEILHMCSEVLFSLLQKEEQMKYIYESFVGRYSKK